MRNNSLSGVLGKSVGKNLCKHLLKQDFWILFLLCFGMSHFIFGAYCLYAIAPIIILLLPKVKMDRIALLWLAFGGLYLLTTIINPNLVSKRNLDWLFFYPMICYLVGKYIVQRYGSYSEVICYLYVALFICFSGREFLAIIGNMVSYGLISVERVVVNENGEILYTATLYALYLCVLIAGLGMMFDTPANESQKRLKKIIVGLGIVSFLAMMSLVTRASLLLGVVLLMLSLYHLFFSKHRKNDKPTGFILFFIVSILLIFVLKSDYADNLFFEFSQRNLVDANEWGGRLPRWGDAISNIYENPLGTSSGRLDSSHYVQSWAHNMWLDVFLHSGWLAGAILLFLSLRSFNNVIKLQTKQHYSLFLRHYMMAVSLTFLVSCFFEPVVESVYGILLIFSFHGGIVDTLVAVDHTHKTNIV